MLRCAMLIQVTTMHQQRERFQTNGITTPLSVVTGASALRPFDMDENVRDELRQELSSLGPRGRGRPYPKELLQKLLSYAVARRRQGASIVAVATELGIHFATLARWLGEKKSGRRFERVDAGAAPKVAARSLCGLVVHGPRGLRIEGLDLDGVVELLRRVAE